MSDLTFTLKDLLTLGGICIAAGGLGVWTQVNTKNITALWKQKQDINVCDVAHHAVSADITEIKKDVKELLRRNGGVK